MVKIILDKRSRDLTKERGEKNIILCSNSSIILLPPLTQDFYNFQINLFLFLLFKYTLRMESYL